MTPPRPDDDWLAALMRVAAHYRLPATPEDALAALRWAGDAPAEARLERMARHLGLQIRSLPFRRSLLAPARLPVLVELADGRVGVVERSDGREAVSIHFACQAGLVEDMTTEQLARQVLRLVVLRPESNVVDARVEASLQPQPRHWFWELALRDWKRYPDVMVATVCANLLALGTTLFSMQIYDRVIPAQSEPTLWVLFAGVLMAIGFEFLLRLMRTHVTDTIGKRADLVISDRVFGRALRLRSDARPPSTGSFISQLRELEQVRELITSSTIGTLVDLPFLLLFIAALWWVSEPLAWVALAALPLMVLPGLLMQRPLARLCQEGTREAMVRHAVLVEAVQGLDDIKLLRAEGRFLGQWNHANTVAARVSARTRLITGLMLGWTQAVQGLVYATVLVVGAQMVMKGQMTTGTLVAASMLASRMMSPLAQMAAVMARWQQAKVARKGLDDLMQRPVDRAERSRLIHRPALQGAFELESAVFRYAAEDRRPALEIGSLRIQPGERVAVLGRMGAGKSSLLQLLSGLQRPQSGSITLDGVDLAQIDPSDVRRDVALLTQHARLFHGSLRDNLTLGMPEADDHRILRALTLAGAHQIVQSQGRGLDQVLREGGEGLSGGQRQALLLARTLLREPQVLLLDEPTTGLDDASERLVIQRMAAWLAGRTLVVATHRMTVLQWVDRIVVLDAGRIVLDGPKQKVISQLSAPPATAGQPSAAAGSPGRGAGAAAPSAPATVQATAAASAPPNPQPPAARDFQPTLQEAL